MKEKNTLTSDLTYKKNSLISLLFFIAVVLVNYLSAAGFINGNSQSAVSNSFPTMITPAGFAFSIWGVIYLSMFISIILPLVRKSETDILSINAIARLFWLSTIINIAWTFVFSYKIIWLSAILIVALLINIFIIMKTLKTISNEKNGVFDLAFGLYAGWLSIASVVNFMAFLVSIQFNFLNNPTMFYSASLLVFILIIAFIQKNHRNPFYVLSIIWAFFGIIKNHTFDSYTNPLFLVLIFGIVVLLVVDVLETVRKTKFTI